MKKTIDEYAALIDKLQKQNEMLAGAFEKAARSKAAAEDILNKQQENLVRIYTDMAAEVKQKVDYEKALKSILAIVEEIDNREGILGDILDELSILTIYGYPLITEKSELKKTTLEMALELIDSILHAIQVDNERPEEKLEAIKKACLLFREVIK